MTDLVVSARNLRKVYRLYSGPGSRFLDMFGMLGERPGAYTEHAALDGLSLDIRRGEKVAFIGRNGAGKSTLLKLFTKVIEPTSGTLDVKGKAHALLQIGSGFHPDFTGRENVYAYLAQLGVSGREADAKYAEIVEFAELEEYIRQPVKTYSSGMAVRLMFSTSTAITPDLLVLDEVLGVGDAYFAHKSYDRIRQLCDRDGTTLLLVTHDIYSAISICPRVIWIDRGQILMDGDGPVVTKAYEDSIRQQEEHRLRLRAGLVRQIDEVTSPATRETLIVEVHSFHNEPQPCPVYFSRLELLVDGVPVAALPLGEQTVESARLQFEGSAWGNPVEWQGRQARALLNYGSPFHKIAGVFEFDGRRAPASGRWSLRCEYWSEVPCRLSLHGFAGEVEESLGDLPPSANAWVTHEAASGTGAGDPTRAVSLSGRQGTGDITVTSVESVNASGAQTLMFHHGDPFTLHVDFRIHSPVLRERAQVLVAFHRDGIQDVCRICTSDLEFDAARQREGRIVMHLPRLFLGVGVYTVTVMIAAEGYFDTKQTVFYSINPGVYSSLSRVIEIAVESSGTVASGTAVVGTAEWALESKD